MRTLRSIAKANDIPLAVLTSASRNLAPEKLGYCESLLAVDASAEEELLEVANRTFAKQIEKSKGLEKQERDVQKILNEFEERGYVYIKHHLNGKLVYGLFFLIAIPAGIFFAVNNEKIWDSFGIFSYNNVQMSPILEAVFKVLFVTIFCIICAPLHELIHAVGFLPACHWTWKGNIRIGFAHHMMTAFCHCRVPQKCVSHVIAILLPFILLSIVPLIVGLDMHFNILIFLSILHAIGCLGDFYYLISLVRLKPEFVLDAPSDLGFYTLKRS